jgi:hypothetical protein
MKELIDESAIYFSYFPLLFISFLINYPPNSANCIPVGVATKFNLMKLMLRAGATKMSATNWLESIMLGGLLLSSQTTAYELMPLRPCTSRRNGSTNCLN